MLDYFFQSCIIYSFSVTLVYKTLNGFTMGLLGLCNHGEGKALCDLKISKNWKRSINEFLLTEACITELCLLVWFVSHDVTITSYDHPCKLCKLGILPPVYQKSFRIAYIGVIYAFFIQFIIKIYTYTCSLYLVWPIIVMLEIKKQ